MKIHIGQLLCRKRRAFSIFNFDIYHQYSQGKRFPHGNIVRTYMTSRRHMVNIDQSLSVIECLMSPTPHPTGRSQDIRQMGNQISTFVLVIVFLGFGQAIMWRKRRQIIKCWCANSTQGQTWSFQACKRPALRIQKYIAIC